MRLRQICFVAKDLESALKSFSFIIGSEVCFRDEGVSYFGLENGLLEIDGNFIEVVSPFKQDTTAERFMSKMNGDAGYMLIFELSLIHISDPRDRQKSRMPSSA